MNNEETIEYTSKPKEGEPWDVAIIGSGPAGLTAAIYTTRGACSTIIFAGEAWGGQLMFTTVVDNYPAVPGVQGPDLMQKMREHATMFGPEILQKNVTRVDFNPPAQAGKTPFEIFVGEQKYISKSIIIATGADTKWLEVPGENKLRGRGVSSCAPCDVPFFKNKKVVVVGGGDAAMEEAIVLTKYASSVTIIHRRGEFKASATMQKKVFAKQQQEKVNIIWGTEVVEMMGEGKLEKIRLKTNLNSEQGRKAKDQKWLNGLNGRIVEEKNELVYWEMPTDGLFVAIGHIPATKIFDEKLEKDEKGYIVVHNHTKTNIPGVFVAGDVHDWHYRQAITAAGFGCMAGLEVLKYLDELGSSGG